MYALIAAIKVTISKLAFMEPAEALVEELDGGGDLGAVGMDDG